MKWKWLYILVVFLLLYESCIDLNRTEIEDIDVIRVLGIDKINNQYTVSALYNKNGGADKAAGGINVIEASGKTMSQAYESLKLKNKETITMSQASFVIVGDSAARSGLDFCMDFISRDMSAKTDGYVLIYKGGNASELLKKSQDKDLFLQDDLNAIVQKQRESVLKNKNTVFEVLAGMENPYESLLIPYVDMVDKYLYINGYAVFDQNRLHDFLDNDTSRGIDFLRNNIRSFPIHLDDTIGLVVSNAKTKVRTDLKGKVLNVEINTNFSTNIKEVLTENNIFYDEKFDDNKIEELARKQNQNINHLLQKPIDFSREKGIDIIGLSKIFERQNYKEWQDIKSNWNEYLKNVNYNLVLHSQTAKNYVIGNRR